MADENSNNSSSACGSAISELVQKQTRRLALGCIAGSLTGTGLHLLTRDKIFAPRFHRAWLSFWPTKSFAGIQEYKAELLVLCIGLAVIALAPALGWAVRFVRSWWAGITSILAPLVACVVLGVLNHGGLSPWLTGVVGLASVGALLVAELRRQQPQPPRSVSPALGSTQFGKAETEPRWGAVAGGDPITDWSADLLGRTAVVELLADQAFRFRTPVIALNGRRGDGKSSVLNLLRSAVKGQAVVVSFNAWLPGSEATFAADIFGDIATECRRYVKVPHLRKVTLAFARTVSGSVSYLAGLKELIPSLSQRDELQQLRDAFCRVPLPILVLLDEIDRMQKEELLVLLKVLRGADTIQNVTFVCAFSEDEVRGITGLSPEDLEKFFPVSVTLSTPAPEIVGAGLQSQLKEQLDRQGWFSADQDADFARLFEQLWVDALQSICSNLRKAWLLLNDVLAAGRPIVREINPLDLAGIVAIKRFSPGVYRKINENAGYLTDARRSDPFKDEKDSSAFFKDLNVEINASPQSASVRVL
jgi:hypothetical protein